MFSFAGDLFNAGRKFNVPHEWYLIIQMVGGKMGWVLNAVEKLC